MSKTPPKRTVTKEEREIWRFVTRNDKRLSPDDADDRFDIDSYASNQQSKEVAVKPRELVLSAATKEKLVFLGAGEYAGIDKRTAQRFKKGKMSIEARIDLHGHTQIEAFEMLQMAVLRAYDNEKRCMLVITGKGRDGEGVLRQSLPLWMNAPSIRPKVLAFDEATAKDGGSGAFYVLLKRQRNK